MTHSNLATQCIYSPNHYSGRAYSIQKVTIHHMAGVMSAAQCGAVFASSSRQASSNYGIGNGGEIACYVEEENAPWTSSSYWNDNQAITLEVSNSYAGGDWPISDAAWNSMIRLCADICKRYGIYPTYTGGTDGTFTEHRMYAATGCPGEYIHSRMYKIVEEVRKAMGGSYSGSGWQKNDKGWWYEYGDGSWPASQWEYIDGKWYYFNSDGYMVTGWVHWDGSWYYCTDNGDMVTGWKKIKRNGKESWFWFSDSGEMAANRFLYINSKWYGFDSNGCMVDNIKELAVDKNGAISIS